MPETYTFGMSLMDFLPPLAFIVGAVFLVRLGRYYQNRASVWSLSIGGLLVFWGGFTQAIWKLLMALEIADIRVLRDQQFVLLAPGFLLMFTGVLLFVRQQRPTPALAAMAIWKIPFLAVMTLCSIGMDGILTYHAFNKGARLAGVMFILAVFCLFAMSGMASGEQSITHQWIEQGINLTGQSAFALGSYLLLHRVTREERNW